MSKTTHMRREILEIPDAVERLLVLGRDPIQAAARAITSRDPAFMVTVARGSSDHAATFFKYASELTTGMAVASIAPSIASIYKRPLKLTNSVCVSISQSGKSPDIVSTARMAGQQGALTLAITNHPNSDLAKVCDHTHDLHAGAELSVAATKTFVTSIVSAIWLLAELRQDHDLLAALQTLPAALAAATQTDWGALQAELMTCTSLYCLGRGPALAISNEAALKFKETCQLHAESYSSAEVLHGPVSVIDTGFPIIAFAASDAAEQGLVDVADQMAAKGGKVFTTSSKAQGGTRLETVRTDHPLTDPIALITSFYAMVENLARARGINPDAPRHLKKVTETI